MQGAWVFRNAQIVASSVKRGFPRPGALEQKRLFVQSHLMAGMAGTNEQMYGKVKYLCIGFEHIDYCLFSMMGEDTLLAVACSKPYSIELLASAVAIMTTNQVDSQEAVDVTNEEPSSNTANLTR